MRNTHFACLYLQFIQHVFRIKSHNAYLFYNPHEHVRRRGNPHGCRTEFDSTEGVPPSRRSMESFRWSTEKEDEKGGWFQVILTFAFMKQTCWYLKKVIYPEKCRSFGNIPAQFLFQNRRGYEMGVTPVHTYAIHAFSISGCCICCTILKYTRDPILMDGLIHNIQFCKWRTVMLYMY